MTARVPTLAASISCQGSTSARNEDAFLCFSENGLFAVADGVGGSDRGEVASAVAVRCLREMMVEFFASPHVAAAATAAIPGEALALGALREGYHRANAALLSAAASSGLTLRTTLTAALLVPPWLHLAHCGDSRVYHLTAAGMVRLTDDHTIVADLVRAGALSEPEAKEHPGRSVLTQCVGLHERFRIDAATVGWSAGDRLLLCSDGVHGRLSDSDIAWHLGSAATPAAAATALLQAAGVAGSTDDLTAVVAFDP